MAKKEYKREPADIVEAEIMQIDNVGTLHEMAKHYNFEVKSHLLRTVLCMACFTTALFLGDSIDPSKKAWLKWGAELPSVIAALINAIQSGMHMRYRDAAEERIQVLSKQ